MNASKYINIARNFGKQVQIRSTIAYKSPAMKIASPVLVRYMGGAAAHGGKPEVFIQLFHINSSLVLISSAIAFPRHQDRHRTHSRSD
jgi:hypothetical protein